MPSRKWIARSIVGLAGVLTMWATTGSWDQEETVALIAWASAAGVSWALPNEKEAV